MAKEITKASDLEGVNPLEQVELNYNIFLDPMGPPTEKATGLFAGTFNVNDYKYLVLANAKPSPVYSGKLFVTCDLYRINEDHIIEGRTHTSDHCKQDEPGFSLENEVKRQTDTINKIKLMEFKRFGNLRWASDFL